MHVYVTVELFQGVLDTVKVFRNEQNAKDWERRWLAEHGIRTDGDREAKAANGTEFHLIHTRLNP